ncbi:phytanoyl-CoA dioxygenase domain-containing protein 1 [Patella vulgata]|uniref:phytanoyl-CoA dioxygenase domain-containing protein 1 n=1 Tax=Patella vulgata TaxID=6465 RepID=UPI0024A91E71|nr:phytanoyl-CoA dioxygenase domain-containing protein 1 [Patella vulgata]XP_050415071.2 phytanoyl-CoA dioxygenase domain-containing protein 1 [Patella vulgata]XP_050415072.2 phytanoyl-CoA dioxygenase domain-containing protein 1 [Patella vulgata]XP_050415073.2 phytanoyl-CoA dioxygenase domain-containing protein 1 [Patella vulgata]XP_050415074.2 phytanoyl-CoA dioxygenase domain-containing protein 1 [Patella vulgata]XP_050415075.2 phytanoyl-CoA dioxygenase domain-containing protein 1 [Patella vu
MTTDLSKIHKPLGVLYDPIKDKSEWSKFKLTNEQIEEFWRDGFLLNIPVLTEEQCDKVLQDYIYFLTDKSHPRKDLLYEFHSNQSGDPNNVLMHCLGHWRVTEHFHDLVFLPNVVVPASQLLDKNNREEAVRFWHDQLFAKPPNIGGGVAWHQDYSYWIRTAPMKHLTVHIALDDQSAENGALHYIPGSHNWNRNGLPLPVTDFNFKDMESIQTILTEEEKAAFKPICGNLKKGEASFHHPLAVHGSYGNRSQRPRRAAVLNYFADGVKSNTNEELLKGSKIPKGQKMEGDLYPIVFDPKWM